MDNVLFARGQMALSLAFHIVFAAVGVAMPLLMVIAEVLWRRTRDRDYLALTRAWAKGTAVLFAVGAVSGTVLSFELGLLFPGFMRHAGAVIGMPFSLEGVAFFTEAVFLGVYLYGWRRVSPALHVAAGVIVAISGLASAAFVTIANAWMNAPVGFRVAAGPSGPRFTDIDPIGALATPFAPHEVIHMALAAYMATAFAVAAVHALVLLRRPDGPTAPMHKRALGIALAMAIPTALAQPLVGHWAGHVVAEGQPLKLAAMERHYKTEARAPLHIGGLPDDDRRETRFAIEVPGGLSWLAFGRADAVVQGLEDFPRADWPHPIVRMGFLAMVGIGTLLAALAAWLLGHFALKRHFPDGRWTRWAIVAAGPLGFVAMEAGWILTEVGRQPWTIYGVLRTRDAATPMPGLIVPFTISTLIYLGLAAAVAAILFRQVRATVPGTEAAR